MSQAKRTSAALPGHRHFHVFRTRLQKWPRLFSSWSKAAKKRRLLFQALSHFCMYLSLSVCVHVYSVNATKHRWCLYENEKKKREGHSHPCCPVSVPQLFFLPFGGVVEFARKGVSVRTVKVGQIFDAQGCHVARRALVQRELWAKSTSNCVLTRFASSNESREVAWHSKKGKRKERNRWKRKWCFHLRSSWQKKKLYQWQMSASSAQHPVEVKPRYNELDDTRKVCR